MNPFYDSRQVIAFDHWRFVITTLLSQQCHITECKGGVYCIKAANMLWQCKFADFADVFSCETTSEHPPTRPEMFVWSCCAVHDEMVILHGHMPQSASEYDP